MSNSVFTLSLFVSILSITTFADIPPPKGYLLNCGSTESLDINGLKYMPDWNHITIGNGTNIKSQNSAEILPLLTKVRFFPEEKARKSCYTFEVTQGSKYLVRTTYFYGEFDTGKQPPIFDQIVDGTQWSIVNTTEDNAKGLASYYELVVVAQASTLSLCLARNEHTVENSSPFISAIEVLLLKDTLYKGADFSKYALSTVARNSFGKTDDQVQGYEAGFISFPDDEFHRFWQPFKDPNPTVDCQSNVTTTNFWNMPPSKALNSAITTSRGKQLQVEWPGMALPKSTYHISLYFQDNRHPSPFSWRVFNVLVNGVTFFPKLNVTTEGVNVYSSQWPLGGQTQITLIPEDGIPVGPVINAAEIFQLLPLVGKTNPADAWVMEEMKKGWANTPFDWQGDPCLPQQYSWTGVTCTLTNGLARVSTLNMTGIGVSGTLSPNIANLTSLVNIWLGGNKLTGKLPDMSSLKLLETLHLENNQFDGPIPESLGILPRIREIYLQNNKFVGDIPQKLKTRQGLIIR